MKRVFHLAIVGVIGAQALVIGQLPEAARVLNEMRAALGGDTLAAVRSFTANARTSRSIGQFQLTGNVEMACELPDKYVRTEELSMGGGSSTNTLGFNGNVLIRKTGQPVSSAMGQGTVMIRPSGAGAAGASQTPEQQAALNATMMRQAKAEFTRYTVAMFGSSFAGHPVEFTYSGQADAPDGKADIIDVKGPDDFKARLYIDARTRHPLMMSWHAVQPQVVTSGFRADGPTAVTPMQRDSAAATDPRPTVENRFYFSDYRVVDGVRLPHQIVREVNGTTQEEIKFERFRLNAKIDAGKFRN